ncbi:hypothetical protein ACRE_007370 [Hapsidospora chrysogenum ATCC 11550]|uniref:CENP-V/GFA domain-containing protein n=1 Tax=Hapsidospora chrysogenum (strain ATCC 11550 / CBS 779.69 / DSM 880 / IAM 14645 / JCM 23072 / IMI 49137) TaxID=857340 RepID=A0A086TGQ8_HAPC1|nr:hypothetical protein ACRE_007370 [Hapsidospora chrysogenum ATCC 11550]
MAPTLHIRCLCGAIHEQVLSRREGDSDQASLSLCHCDACRHSSGTLSTSYYPILEPTTLSDNLGRYDPADGGSTRYFCAKCGCHVFRSNRLGSGSLEWKVATGVVASTTDIGGDATDARYTRHTYVADTQDGGASIWIPMFDGESVQSIGDSSSFVDTLPPIPQSSDSEESLGASCACGRVRFHITRPGPQSRNAHSDYPDLLYAYNKTPVSIRSNPNREKWWLCGEGRYLAGTCACASCRLATGFEIQTWAFVPRANIFAHIPDPATADSAEDRRVIVPLDFETLGPGVLSSYSSSPGVFRDFCGRCGATVFWRDNVRPGKVDVSVGLLRADEGARAESWLSWWTRRVSFEEEAGTGRRGAPARTAKKLIVSLQEGLKEWAEGSTRVSK